MFNKFLYKSYRFFYLLETFRRRSFTTSGLFVVFTIIISGVLGIDTTRNTIYQIFCFALFLLLISVIWSLFFKVRCEVKRKLPQFVTVGESFRYKVEIENKKKKFEKDLSIFENPKDPRPTLDELMKSREPDEEKRNIWDRKTLYYRWLWLIRQNQKAWFREIKIPDIAPGNTIGVDIELTPNNRGYIYFNGVIISRPDPFKLFMAFRRLECKQKLLVLPKRYNLPHFDLPGNRKYNSGGVALASAIGNSNEFVSLREYRPGDSVRNIHWKSWAKTGDLIIKEFQDEYFTRHALILDTFHEHPHSRLFEEAVSVASSFACSLETEESILDLMFVGKQAYRFSSGRGLATSEKMLEILSCVQTIDEKNIVQLFPVIEEYVPLLSGSICIFLKWDEKRKKLTEILKTAGVPILIIVITDNRKQCEHTLKEYTAHVNIVELGRVQEDLMLMAL